MPIDENRSTQRNGVVARITAILESFTRETPRLPLRDIAAAAGLPASTTRRLLVQLEDSGLVFQDPGTQLYGPTTKLAHIGALALSPLSLEEVARPGLQKLSEISGEAAFLGALRHQDVVYLAHETVAREVTISIQTGDTREALSTAIGSVIIAHTPGLYQSQSTTRIFDEHEFSDTLEDRFHTTVEQVTKQGFVLGLGGIRRESTSLAIPVSLPGQDIPVAIALSGPTYRFTEEDALKFLPELRAEAQKITNIFANHSS